VEDFPRVRALAGFLAVLVLPLLLEGTEKVDEFAEEGAKYGDEGTLETSFRLEEVSSSGTLVRLRLEEESIP